MSEQPLTYTGAVRVPQDHPSLPGHFPGRPIVAGVLLLDLVLERAERCLGRPISVAALTQAKFTAPLLPGQEAHVALRIEGETLRFTLTCEDAPIAQGVFRLAAGRPT